MLDDLVDVVAGHADRLGQHLGAAVAG